MLRAPALSPWGKREAGIRRKSSTYREEGGRGWVWALPWTSPFPLGLGFPTCTKAEHNPCLAPSKGLSEASMRAGIEELCKL